MADCIIAIHQDKEGRIVSQDVSQASGWPLSASSLANSTMPFSPKKHHARHHSLFTECREQNAFFR